MVLALSLILVWLVQQAAAGLSTLLLGVREDFLWPHLGGFAAGVALTHVFARAKLSGNAII